MEDKDSLLGKAKARLEARKIGGEQLRLVTEDIFADKVKPKLEQMEKDFLQEYLPAIFFPLVEEVKQFIEKKEGRVIESERQVKYSLVGDLPEHNFNITDGYIESLERESYNQKKLLVELFEKRLLGEKTMLSVKVSLGDFFRIRVEFKGNNRKYGCSVGLGSQGFFHLSGRSIEEENKFTEDLLAALEEREYIGR